MPRLLVLVLLVVLALGGTAGCRKPVATELIRAGMAKAEVVAALHRHGAHRITDIVRADPRRTEDWYVQGGTCIQLLYDPELKLTDIVLGSTSRGWNGQHDWEQQSHTRCKQMYLR